MMAVMGGETERPCYVCTAIYSVLINLAAVLGFGYIGRDGMNREEEERIFCVSV